MAGTAPTLAQLLASPAGPMQPPVHGLRVRVESISTGTNDPPNHSDASKGEALRIHCRFPADGACGRWTHCCLIPACNRKLVNGIAQSLSFVDL